MSTLEEWQRVFPGEEVVGLELLGRWREGHRRYHTVAHLGVMLGVIDEYVGLVDDPDVVRLAAWFHDAVYDVFAGDNEERSAELARVRLGGLGVSAERVSEIVRLVLLTAGHHVAAGDMRGGLLADADLAILAGSAEDYARYALAVREEYAAVPDAVFRPGRAGVLRKLADLPELYRVVPQRAEWTARARANLEAEIVTLLDAR
ncbi:metal-dependent phosphohydrolase [Dactylosporangium sp. NPDC051541]|uniref:metal-dependent phosphohydrolase n=1 Tax=Dactylosporangium sp. NPDC051541 TaxID=3363977 RepID=UPI0037A7D8C8